MLAAGRARCNAKQVFPLPVFFPITADRGVSIHFLWNALFPASNFSGEYNSSFFAKLPTLCNICGSRSDFQRWKFSVVGLLEEEEVSGIESSPGFHILPHALGGLREVAIQIRRVSNWSVGKCCDLDVFTRETYFLPLASRPLRIHSMPRYSFSFSLSTS